MSNNNSGRRTAGKSRFRRQLNPAFANAHGLPSSSSVRNDTQEQKEKGYQHNSNDTKTSSSATVVERIVQRASQSGKVIYNSNADSNIKISVLDLIEEWDKKRKSVDLSMNNSSYSNASYVIQEVTVMDLSYASTTFVQFEPIWFQEHFLSLQTLRLRDCGLETFCWEALSTCAAKLSILDLSGNQLTRMETHAASSSSSSLKELNVSRNNITQWQIIPCQNDINQHYWENLTCLDISHNPQLFELPCIPTASPYLNHSLQKLLIHNTAIRVLPSSYLAPTLVLLDASHCALQQIPDSFAHCTSVTDINLSHNKALTSIPKIPTSLIRLSLNSNQISTMEGMMMDNMEKQYQLQELYLAQNQLQSLDIASNHFQNIHTLDIRDNAIAQLPLYQIAQYLVHLKKIYVNGNPILNVTPKTLIYDPTQSSALLSKIKSYKEPQDCSGENKNKNDNLIINIQKVISTRCLDMTKKDLLKIMNPNKWKQLWLQTQTQDGNTFVIGHTVHRINLSFNSLTSLNEWLLVTDNHDGTDELLFPNLREIHADNNQLSTLSYGILSMHLHCHTITLSQNNLTDKAIDNAFGDGDFTSKLQSLDLSGNKLSAIPQSLVSSMSSELESLNLSYNQIREVPQSSKNDFCFKNILHLNLSNNRISDLGFIPNDLLGTSIQSLQLQNNELITIPIELGALVTLRTLNLVGNPQRMIRGTILDRGCGAILSYLQGRMLPEQYNRLIAGKNEVINDSTKSEDKSEESNRKHVPKMETNHKNKKSSTLKTANKPSIDNTTNNAVIERLRQNIGDLTLQLKQRNISQAQKYALKKNLAIEKSKLIREERKLKK